MIRRSCRAIVVGSLALVLTGCIGTGSDNATPNPSPSASQTTTPTVRPTPTPTPTSAVVPSEVPAATVAPTPSDPPQPATPAVAEAIQAEAWQACVTASQQVYPDWASYEPFAPGAVTSSGTDSYTALVSWTDEFEGKTTSLVTTCEIASDMSVIQIGAQSLG